MSAKNYAGLAAAVFAIVAALHLVRAIMGWEAAIGAQAIPMWASWVAILVAGGLAWLGFRAARA
jgi:hypothetical protein